MGLCLDAVGKLKVVEHRARKEFTLLAKHRRSHLTITAGCLRLSRLTPRLVSWFFFGV